MAFEDEVEAVDALAGAGVHFVRHGGGTDLAFGEAFGGEFVAGHEAEGAAEGRGAGGDVAEGGDGAEVEGAGIDLADGVEGFGDAEVTEDALLELAGFGGVAIEEADLVHAGADGAFEATGGVGVDEVLEIAEAEEEFLAEHGEAFAEGGGLGGDVVSAGGEGDVAGFGGAFGEGGEGGDGFVPDDVEGTEDLQLLDVLGEVAAGHAFVDVLMASEVAELFDAGFDVVAGDALALHDGGDVDLFEDGFVGFDDASGDGLAEVALGFEDGDPVLAFEADFAFGGPDGAHGGGGVAISEDVGDGVGHGGRGIGILGGSACTGRGKGQGRGEEGKVGFGIARGGGIGVGWGDGVDFIS